MRITRREFIKYCAAAAGALGLTTTDLVKLEKALATPPSMGGTQVVWLNGASCTGCTVSFANSAYYSSVQDLLVPWVPAAQAISDTHFGDQTPAHVTDVVNILKNADITEFAPANGPLDLVFSETLSSAVGHRAVLAAETALDGTYPFVLCIEGSIQTGSDGNFCKVGAGTSAGDIDTTSFADEVFEYATNANCIAVLAVGTCASFGGIPASRGSVTDAKGLISTGKITGGYQTTNTEGFWDYKKNKITGRVASIQLTTFPSHSYASAPVVSFAGGGSPTTAATATASINSVTGTITGLTLTSAGAGYSSAPTVSIAGNFDKAKATLETGIDSALWTSLMSKTVCVPGCPPHPDWIVGTIVYILTYGEPPLTDKWHRPTDFYGSYQCDNCLWQTNEPGKSNVNPVDGGMRNIDETLLSTTTQATVTKGNSPKLYKNKYNSQYEGCLGVLGCKGRKTKADCSYRRWNGDAVNSGGVSWCVQTRAGCHGCTDPRFPDGWGKFFAFK